MLINIPNIGCFESDGIIGISNDYSVIHIKRIVHVIKEHPEESNIVLIS